jgi:phosphoglycolate phosphatase-like HAD superfamily hydrolase
MSKYRKEDLIHLVPKHKTFVGIDSDGCVFPTMEIKQKQCFHSEIIRVWGLERIEKPLRECAEFVNLYSKWRGINRFPALLMTFDLLKDRAEAQDSGVPLPSTAALKKYIDSGVPLSNATLKAEVEKTGDPELKRLLQWSYDVNANIERTVKQVPPFKWVRESLEKIAKHSDMIVVSQTPEEALVREWDENGIAHFVPVIAGQELGTKAEHIGMATKDRYPSHRILMIGDAPGDLKAARANQAFFFPVNPGHEEESWNRFHAEAYERFLNGTYDSDYEQKLITTFDSLLPDVPGWKKR